MINEQLSGIEIGDEVREKVAKLQGEKQRVMEWIKNQLDRIKRGEQIELEDHGSSAFRLEYRDGALIAYDNNQEFNVTLGEVLTDASWGIDYELDPESIAPEIAKQYVLSRAKMRLQKLLNEQLVLIELAINKDDKQCESFQAIRDRQLEGKHLVAQDRGFVAEQMIFNLIKKLSIDNELPVTIEGSYANLGERICLSI